MPSRFVDSSLIDKNPNLLGKRIRLLIVMRYVANANLHHKYKKRR